jgi:prefoldin subunit 5
MGKEIKPVRVLVPVEQAIAQIAEAIDCYQDRIAALQAEMRILRDE